MSEEDVELAQLQTVDQSQGVEESDDEDGDLLPVKDLGAALKGRNDFYLRQEREAGNCLECTFGCEFVNQFSLCDSKNGRVLLKLVEDSECCNYRCMKREFCPNLYDFTINVFQKADDDEPVAKFVRPTFNCSRSYACFPWPMNHCFCVGCDQYLELQSVKRRGGKKKLGYVRELSDTTCANGNLAAYDGDGNELLRVEIPCLNILRFVCCNDVVYQFKRDGELVGTLTRAWKWSCGHILGDLDDFKIEFFEDLSKPVTTLDKMLALALTIQIKYIYFETDNS